jgi:predicted TIM-barrel fold metal-dependent hydrolase
MRGRLSGQFLWGRDFPFLSPERCLTELSGLGLPPDILNTVLRDNAERILGLA